MDRGSKFYAPTGETTEWEDILVKKGIIAPRYPKEDDLEEEQEEEVEIDPLESLSKDELDEVEDDYDDEILREYREKRIQEWKARAARCKFGEIYPITKVDWIDGVTEASKENWVVAFLFDDNVEDCEIMENALKKLAVKHGDIKFVKIPSRSCIENWPERNLPTLFIYHQGELKHQVITLHKVGGKLTTSESIEEHLHFLNMFTNLN